MKKIQLLNKIAAVGTDRFARDAYEVGADVASPDAIMVRSAAMHDMTFDANLLAIARCGAGVNNIPVERCADEGIVVFNTPGANANGVKELAIAALILAARDIIGGVEWVKTLVGEDDIAKKVEAGKSAYAGRELAGKTLGVVGLGAIGGMVANAAQSLGMRVMGHDPFLSVNAAWNLSSAIINASDFAEIFKNADYITLHVPATKDTKKMINKETLATMKDGVRIINLSRADLVDAEAMKEALASGKVAAYVTDFPTGETVGCKGIVNIPHLGASTQEAEDNCAVMAADQLNEYLMNGNIKNSVNFPAVAMPRAAASRLCLLHKNASNILSDVTALLSNGGLNIKNMANGSRGDYAYTIVDFDEKISDELLEKCRTIEGMIRTRAI